MTTPGPESGRTPADRGRHPGFPDAGPGHDDELGPESGSDWPGYQEPWYGDQPAARQPDYGQPGYPQADSYDQRDPYGGPAYRQPEHGPWQPGGYPQAQPQGGYQAEYYGPGQGDPRDYDAHRQPQAGYDEPGNAGRYPSAGGHARGWPDRDYGQPDPGLNPGSQVEQEHGSYDPRQAAYEYERRQYERRLQEPGHGHVYLRQGDDYQDPVVWDSAAGPAQPGAGYHTAGRDDASYGSPAAYRSADGYRDGGRQPFGQQSGGGQADDSDYLYDFSTPGRGPYDPGQPPGAVPGARRAAGEAPAALPDQQPGGQHTGLRRVVRRDGSPAEPTRSRPHHGGANGGSADPDSEPVSWPEGWARTYTASPGPSTQAGPGWFFDETGPVPIISPDLAAEGPSVVRSSSVMAMGTLASRFSGVLRTLVQAWALGGVALSVAYNNANTLPNVVYNLALGGILTSVIVPLIVNATKRDADRGEAFNQRMFTMITIALLAITIVATIAAAPIVDLYKGSISGQQLHLVVIFAYFFIPQIFFYGMSSLMGAVLNSRGSFAAPMWTPVVNNVVVILVLLMFMTVGGHAQAAHAGASTVHLSGGQIGLLGLGTTLGIVAQTAALFPALRHVGFRWQPRFDFRREETREIGRMAGWMFCYIAATQVAFLVTTVICNIGANKDTGYTAYTYAWQLFQMPYAVVGISVITALLPRMSAHATERKFGRVREDFSSGVRLASAIVVPSAFILAVLGPALAIVLFAHGNFHLQQAHGTGIVFAMFCLGLLPYTMFQLQLRVFYSLHDSRTPALIGLITMTVNIVANLLALWLLHGIAVIAALGLGFGLANLVGAALAGRILSVRLRGLDGWNIRRTLVRMHVATLPAVLFALLVVWVIDALVGGRLLGSLAIVLLAGTGGLAIYVLTASALRITEVTDLTRTVLARFRR